MTTAVPFTAVREGRSTILSAKLASGRFIFAKSTYLDYQSVLARLRDKCALHLGTDVRMQDITGTFIAL